MVAGTTLDYGFGKSEAKDCEEGLALSEAIYWRMLRCCERWMRSRVRRCVIW
jgi:hypothetical protein